MIRRLVVWVGMGLLVGALVGCDGDGDGMVDAGPAEDAGPVEPFPIDHCAYEEVPATAGAGGTVTAGELSAGTAESFIDVPLGTSVGSYTSRAEGFGSDGIIPAPDQRSTQLAGTFAPSVGIETIPRIRALALSAGGETVVILKVDLSLSYQGFVHDVEATLGPEYSGKVIIAASHSHSSFGNYTGHTAMFVGFGEMRDSVYQAMVAQFAATAQQAIDALEPAQIGITLDDDFDPMDRVNRDRRPENDELAGGRQDDNQLFLIRVDTAAGEPMAMLPVFGMHGTIHGGDNTMISTDSTGGFERVIEESFDSDVLVMHLQGAAGDVSPAGSGSTDCGGRDVCADYARPETIGHYGLDEVRAAWEAAGMNMQTSLEIEMLTRTVPLGPDWTTFTIRDGALEYAPMDNRTAGDGEVYAPDGTLLSPIDEFNAPTGAALCGAGEDLGLRLPRAGLPGADVLNDYSYFNCNRVREISNVLESLIQVDFEEAPLCETTRTTVSALRLGDWMIGTMPGELVTILRDRIQAISPMPPERTILLGYAQDHGGYLLSPEDWLSGGYEPSISFWGPLEGEYVGEQTAALMELAMTPERENGNEGGMPRPSTPLRGADNIPLDNALDVGTVPPMTPSYLLTHNLQTVTSMQPAAQVERVQTAFFSWIGDDPMRGGTPRVTLQRETSPGVWEDVTRRSGRVVQDGDLLLTWTPNPIFRMEGTPRTHYYTVEFQVVAPLGMPGLDAIADRTGMPLGNYRFHVTHSSYELDSDPFEVVPAQLESTVETSGADATVTLGVLNENGYRLLDLGNGPSNQLVPLRSQEVSVVVGAGMPMTLSTDADGRVQVPGAVGNAVVINDSYGNTVTVNP